MSPGRPVWLFAYGSLIWRPDFPFLDQTLAVAAGWERRFWQGSHDHRGTETAPGRVVTLVANPDAACAGVAFLLDPAVMRETFDALDHREKNGYKRFPIKVDTASQGRLEAVTYRAEPGNPAWLGDAPLAEVAALIATANGPSGTNSAYLYGLAQALRARDIDDAHVFGLEAAVQAVLARTRNGPDAA